MPIEPHAMIAADQSAVWEDIKDKTMAVETAHLVDGLLRIERGPGRQICKANHFTVTDIFKFQDGSNNLNIILTMNPLPNVYDPAGLVSGWIAYRFLFAGIYR